VNGPDVTSDDDAAPPSSASELEALARLIDGWAARQLAENSVVAAAERDPEDPHRWLVRVNGDEKSVFTIWFWLRQRTLHVETYVMPAPLERAVELYEYLLRRNHRLSGLTFTIGLEDAVYLEGQIPNIWVTEAELDRLLGSAYAYTEAHFRPGMRIGYGERFDG
jgi:hypothetical protein